MVSYEYCRILDLLLIGFFESFTAGWMFDLDKQFEELGRPIVLLYMFSTFASIIVASVLWFLIDGIPNMMSGFIALAGIWGIGMAIVLVLCSKKKEELQLSWKELLYKLMFENIFELRNQLSESVGFLPGIWCILIKHVIPSTLLVLFLNLAAAQTSSGEALFGHYEGYATYPYQFIGILIVSLTLFLLALGFVAPNLYDILADPEDSLKDINAAHEENNKSITVDGIL